MAFIKRFTLFATSLLALTSVALGALLLAATGLAAANNPPSTVFGTVAIDPTEPPPDTDITTDDSSPVNATIEANGRIYVAGDFEVIGNESRRSLAAIEVATGQLDQTFDPVISGSAEVVHALALSPDGTDLYVGGRFTQVDGTFRIRLAKIDAFTGELDPTFNPNIDARVDTIETDGTSVWVGGQFDNVNGQAVEHLAKLDATTGAVDTSWIGTADAVVRDV